MRDSQHFNTKKVEKLFETPGNSVKQGETVTDTETFGFQLLSEKLDIFYTTPHNILGFFHQLVNLYSEQHSHCSHLFASLPIAPVG